MSMPNKIINQMTNLRIAVTNFLFLAFIAIIVTLVIKLKGKNIVCLCILVFMIFKHFK